MTLSRKSHSWPKSLYLSHQNLKWGSQTDRRPSAVTVLRRSLSPSCPRLHLCQGQLGEDMRAVPQQAHGQLTLSRVPTGMPCVRPVSLQRPKPCHAPRPRPTPQLMLTEALLGPEKSCLYSREPEMCPSTQRGWHCVYPWGKAVAVRIRTHFPDLQKAFFFTTCILTRAYSKHYSSQL